MHVNMQGQCRHHGWLCARYVRGETPLRRRRSVAQSAAATKTVIEIYTCIYITFKVLGCSIVKGQQRVVWGRRKTYCRCFGRPRLLQQPLDVVGRQCVVLHRLDYPRRLGAAQESAHVGLSGAETSDAHSDPFPVTLWAFRELVCVLDTLCMYKNDTSKPELIHVNICTLLRYLSRESPPFARPATHIAHHSPGPTAVATDARFSFSPRLLEAEAGAEGGRSRQGDESSATLKGFASL
jgi:hypothetical protein